jgi:hypothetical protein
MEQGETAALTFILRNGAQLFPPPASNVNIVVTTTDPNVTITNAEQFVQTLQAGSTFNVVPILLQFQSNAPDHWVVMNIDVSSDGGQFTYHLAIEFTLGTPHLLIVEDDPTSETEHFVRQTARAQDKIYDLAVSAGSESLSSDFYPDYGMVIWLSGNANSTVLTEQDKAWLSAFLQAGNKVVLSGQDLVDGTNGDDFTQYILQVIALPDTISSHAVTMTMPPFAADEWFLTTGSTGAGNQHSKTAFIPTGSTQACFYGRTEGPVAGVSFAQGHGLLFGFGIEAISGMSGSQSRAHFMDELYAWAGPLLGDVNEQPVASLPANFGIASVYPNPFNSTARINYSIPVNSNGELFIYDVLGRMVDRLTLSATSGVIQWAPSGSSGIYFAQVKWNSGQSQAIKLLQIR